MEESLRLRDDATAVIDDGGRLKLVRGSKRYEVGPLRAELAPSLEVLVAGGAPEAVLRDLVTEAGEAAEQLQLLLRRMDARGWLQRTLLFEGRPLLTVKPLVAKTPQRNDADWSEPLTLSRFALLRRVGEELVIESPLSPATAIVHDPRVAAFVTSMCVPARISELDAGAIGLPLPVLTVMATLLGDAELLAGVEAGEETDMRLAQWSVPDLYFHSRSRQGRHANGYGATWPLRGRFEPLPGLGPAGDRVVAMARPDVAAAVNAGPSFTAVVEGRQSIRAHDDEQPLSLGQLGEFLYRSAGVRHEVTAFSDGSPRPPGMARPYPTGGALYELELYPLVHRCAGLEPGLYRYDAHRHQLDVVTAELNPGLEGLLQQTCAKTGMPRRPQVLLNVTAKFGKVMYKYEAIPYATILKNVGVLYQTMYLVATAMGLAPCAVGGGDSDAFATLAGLDYYEETSVGEFLLGSRPGSTNRNA